jgi:hypothetical protein
MDPAIEVPPPTSPSKEKKGAIPWYITAALLIGLSLVYCHYSYSDFWSLPAKNPGRFVGYLIASFILLPVAAAIAAIAWLITSKVKKPIRVAFSPFWVGSMAAVVGLLYASTQYRAALEEKEWDQKMAASRVAPAELASIELFDGSMSWAYAYSGQSDTIDKVEGRVRNALPRSLSSITVRVGIQNAEGKLIETFDFQIPEVGTYAATPLPPGHVRGFTYRKTITRVPRDMKWSWGIISAIYVVE